MLVCLARVHPHSTRPVLLFLLLRPSAYRAAATSAALRARRPLTRPSDEERLAALRGAEKRIAIIAVGSMLVGYVALKMALSGVAPKKHEERGAGSGSGTGAGQLRPLVVAGPSGAGKSTLLGLLFKEHPSNLGLSVSHTTRKPRQGEVNGREYHFTTREEMKRMIGAGEFIEWAEFSGNMYGTSKKAVKDVQVLGKICVLDIDMQGVRSVKRTDLNPLYVFIRPPSMEELERRLRGRKTESEESLRRRLHAAQEEITFAEGPGVFDHVVVNDDLDKAYQTLKTAIIEELGSLEEENSKNTS